MGFLSWVQINIYIYIYFASGFDRLLLDLKPGRGRTKSVVESSTKGCPGNLKDAGIDGNRLCVAWME